MSAVLLPLIACAALSVLATAILVRDSSHDVSRVSAALLCGAAFWTFCEVLWANASDPATAHALVKLSALGWVAVGPMSLHLIIEVIGEPADARRRQLRRLYAVSLGFLMVDWMSPWIHPAVVKTPWGFGYELGPAYPFYWAFTVLAIGWGLYLGDRAYRRIPYAA